MITVSKKDIDTAYDKMIRLINEAYLPMQVGDQFLCWEGRIANATNKAGEFIESGKFNKDQVWAVIRKLEGNHRSALAAAKDAQEQYWTLCKTAGLEPKALTRPRCECTYCKEQTIYNEVEQYREAIHQAVALGFNDESVELCRRFAAHMSARGIVVEMSVV